MPQKVTGGNREVDMAASRKKQLPGRAIPVIPGLLFSASIGPCYQDPSAGPENLTYMLTSQLTYEIIDVCVSIRMLIMQRSAMSYNP